MHEEEVLGKAYDARLMRRLLGYLEPYRLQVVLALAAITGLVAAGTAALWFHYGTAVFYETILAGLNACF